MPTTNPIRIFIAKSFRETDRARIQPVEGFLDSFARLGVEVETGEPSEPESISQKVRERIDRADVFVGVFTRRFPIYSGHALARAILEVLRRPSRWSAPPWVLQECGYAVAKGQKLILFLESGVDMGGLQGDLEFIPYDYLSPADSLTKASFMLNSIIAKHLGASVQTSIETGQAPQVLRTEEQVAAASLASTAPPQGRDEPSPSDPLKPIFISLLAALEERDFDTAERQFQDGLVIVSAGGAILSELEWSKLYFSSLFRRGVTKGLDGLRGLATRYPDESEVPKTIGSCLMGYGEFESARIEYLRAVQLSTPPDRYENELLVGTCLRKAGKNGEAREFLRQTLMTAGNASPDLKSRIMKELSAAYRDSGEKFLGFAMAELGLRENPANRDLRFQLGWDYHNEKYFDLDAFHYNMLIASNSADAGAQHNFALACSALSLPIVSIENYKSAFANGETLSASNIAYKFLDAGFQSESEMILREALAKADCVPEVQHTLGIANSRRQDERQKLDDFLRKAEGGRDFLVRLGEGMLATAPVAADGTWELELGDVVFRIDGSTLNGSGEIDLSGSDLVSMVLLSASSGKKHQTLSLEGTFFGRACKYNMTVRSLMDGSYLIDSARTNGYILFHPSMDRAEIVAIKDGVIQEVKLIRKKVTEVKSDSTLSS